MPNWCQNVVRVTATDRGKAEAFVGFVRNGDNYFSFNKIIPMPDELEGTRSPTRIVPQEEYDEWTEATSSLDGGRPLTQELSDRFKKEYGYDNWYDWANVNWGAKWDTDCEEVNIDDFGGVEYRFDTPWGPPEPICDTLRELFPKLDISWYYHEPNMQMAGYLDKERA